MLDRLSSTYWRGTYDKASDTLDLYILPRTKPKYATSPHKWLRAPELHPEWDIVFDPHAKFRVDIEGQRVNTFQPTEFMKSGRVMEPASAPGIPHHPEDHLHHALGSDQAVTDRFINWLATIAQTLDRTRTAWILHGRTGTGKGLLMSEVITPLFGKAKWRRSAWRS
jgi:hypothetical protein